MTVSAAERINGCKIWECQPGIWGAWEGGICRAQVATRKEKVAIFLLVNEIYRQNRMAALKRDGYRCVNCGGTTNLQAHHKKHRKIAGSDRNDRLNNLITLCGDCHEHEHSVRLAS